MWNDALRLAKELGATISGGINWTWANGLTKENADKFMAFLVENRFDHRGIYQDNEQYHIRFR